MLPGQFLIINGLYLNTSIVACIDPYFTQSGAGGGTASNRPQGRGGGRAGVVRVTLDARAIQPAYPGQGQPTLPLVFDIANSAEMAHARRLLTSWGQTGIATGLTGPAGTGVAQSGGGAGETEDGSETPPQPAAVRRRGPSKKAGGGAATKTAGAGGGG